MLATQRQFTALEAIHQEREVLYQLLDRQRECLVVWDLEGRAVCMSSGARRHLEVDATRVDLERAVYLTLRGSRRGDAVPGETAPLQPSHVRSASGTPLLVEFSWIAASERQLWLLGRLRERIATPTAIERLSRAETRVLRLLVQGFSNAEICKLLSVSKETVKTHVKRILAKLDVRSRGKAAAIAREAWGEGLTD